jgi:DNA-binding XRE family transcriptional regulator
VFISNYIRFAREDKGKSKDMNAEAFGRSGWFLRGARDQMFGELATATGVARATIVNVDQGKPISSAAVSLVINAVFAAERKVRGW